MGRKDVSGKKGGKQAVYLIVDPQKLLESRGLTKQMFAKNQERLIETILRFFDVQYLTKFPIDKIRPMSIKHISVLISTG